MLLSSAGICTLPKKNGCIGSCLWIYDFLSLKGGESVGLGMFHRVDSFLSVSKPTMRKAANVESKKIRVRQTLLNHTSVLYKSDGIQEKLRGLEYYYRHMKSSTT